MQKQDKKIVRTFVITAVLILVAYICRFLGNNGIMPKQVGLIRSFIYISLFIAWGLSIRSRIIQSQARRYMTAIAIRLCFKKNGRVFVRSGAGIVADSVPEKEFQECINKAKAVVEALKAEI